MMIYSSFSFFICLKSAQNHDIISFTNTEANAIISASRRDMIGATLYLVGMDSETGLLVSDACSCAMCKRMIINSGIEKVVIRNTPDKYTVINVSDWVDNDDSLGDKTGY